MKKRRYMSCEEFTARMPQLIASGEDIFAHPHVKSCRMHQALLLDLEAIARAAQQLFPDVDPADNLWAKIEEEIALPGGIEERVSNPFPGCRLVFRTKLVQNWHPQDNPMPYDDPFGARNLPVSGTRTSPSGHKSPPHPREGR